MTSESESEEDLVYTNTDSDMPSTVNFAEVPGYTEVIHPKTCTDTPTFQYPVKEALDSDDITNEIHGGDTTDLANSAATVSPQNKEDADKDDEVRQQVLETCTQLLLKLETVRLSVLHLQYSMHAGALASSQIESIDRSSRLWAWDRSSKLGEIHPVEIPSSFKLSGDKFNTEIPDSVNIEISDSFNISDDALSELDVFGVPELLKELDTHLGSNIDNVSTASDPFDGVAAKGCF